MKILLGIVGLATIAYAASIWSAAATVMQQGVGASVGVAGAVFLGAAGIIGAIEDCFR